MTETGHCMRALVAWAFAACALAAHAADADLDPAFGDGHQVTQVRPVEFGNGQAWVGDVGRWLGIGLANLAAALDPAIFVIGGGVSQTGEMLLRPARFAFHDHLTGRGYRSEARIVAAHLGNDAGLVGAADLARLRARRRRPASPGYSVRGPAVARSGRRRRRPRR